MKFKLALTLAVLLQVGCSVQDSSTYKQKTSPERVDAWNNVAREYIRQGQFENAKRPLKQALEIDQGASSSLVLMAYVFQSQGENETAEEYYKKALSGASNDSTIHNNYGIFLLLAERYPEACKHLAVAADDPLYDQRIQAMENLASCYSNAGHGGKAEKSYLQVLRLNPNSANAIVEMSAIEYKREEYGKSFQYFEQYSDLVRLKQADYTAKSLYLGVLLSRENNDPGRSATFALLLKNMYPNSLEYQRYKESR
ncbi:MAG: type IV pilus biogenesis/stability protein PilW [Motiliproteus sp.]